MANSPQNYVQSHQNQNDYNEYNAQQYEHEEEHSTEQIPDYHQFQQHQHQAQMHAEEEQTINKEQLQQQYQQQSHQQLQQQSQQQRMEDIGNIDEHHQRRVSRSPQSHDTGNGGRNGMDLGTSIENDAQATDFQESGSNETAPRRRPVAADITGQPTTANKLFIGGLNFSTTEDSLHQFFQKWGEIEEVEIVKDKETQTSRGFGFVMYKDKATVDAVLADLRQNPDAFTLDKKPIEPKRAITKEAMRDQPLRDYKTTKLWVGELWDGITDDDLRQHFSALTHVENVELGIEKSTNRFRGFAFVTVQSEAEVDRLTTMAHSLNGRNIVVRKAQPPRRDRELRGDDRRGFGRNSGHGRERRDNFRDGGYGRPPREDFYRDGRRGGFDDRRHSSGSYDAYPPHGGYGGGYAPYYGGGYPSAGYEPSYDPYQQYGPVRGGGYPAPSGGYMNAPSPMSSGGRTSGPYGGGRQQRDNRAYRPY